MPTPPVENDVTGSRFVIRSEQGTAELTYTIAGNQIILRHTEVPKALRGSGRAGRWRTRVSSTRAPMGSR